MNLTNHIYPNNQVKSIQKLIQIMRDDALINKKVLAMLKMDSYRRRSMLNDWLEQLRTLNAPENLMKALSFLFDDKIAEEILDLINNNKI